MDFEWYDEKAKSNFLKHGVSFDDAKVVFYDRFAFVRKDAKHSQTEERYLIVGVDNAGRVLVTIFTKRDTKIRIISSRRANEKERKKYAELRR